MSIKEIKSEQRSKTCLISKLDQLLLQTVAESPAACYHLQSGGGRTRAKLCLDAGEALNIPQTSIMSLAACIELLHNASLIHDDLQDDDIERRGRASVWKRFGKDIALCAGDLMLSNAYSVLSDYDDTSKLPQLLKCVAENVAQTIDGQCKDIHQQCRTLAEFEEIAAKKSGPLLQLSIALPLLASGHGEHAEIAHKAMKNFAVAYQIIDDMNDCHADHENGQLNIVNLLSREQGIEHAKEYARNRAQYLLKRCEHDLQFLPNNCGSSAIKASQHLFSKVCRRDHE